MYKTEQLGANDYDELLQLLNKAFNKPEGNTFDVFLPVMWERDDEHMSKHIAIRQDGKICAVVGIYPLPAIVCGEPVAFATIGNVATLPEYEGKGMMKALMTQALKEAKQMGIDIARLGGLRQRYNRYGFDNAGVNYSFKLTQRNLSDFFGKKVIDGETVYGGSPLSRWVGLERKFEFKQVTLADPDLLDNVMELEKTAPLYAVRGDRKQFFKTLSAYQHKIWGAINQDKKLVGYLCVSPDNTYICEHRAITAQDEYQMLLEWLLFSGADAVSIQTAPWECRLNALLGQICELWMLGDTSHFHPFNWTKLLSALLRLKSEYTHIPDGELVLHIEGYGTIKLSGNTCTDTDEAPQITLGHLEAIRFLLGSLPVQSSCPQLQALDQTTRSYAQSVLPLPLWWCNQDRV